MVFVSVRNGIAIVVLCLFGVAGCGDDESANESSAAVQDTEQRPPTGEATVCELFERVEQLDDESQAIVNEALGPALSVQDPAAAEVAFDNFLAVYKPFARNELPRLLETYDELANEVPMELRADVEVLADFSEHLGTRLASARTLEELQELFTGDSERTQEAVSSTFRLDEYSRETCDVVLAD